MIYIQEVSWDQPEIDKDNIFLNELITRKKEIVSDNNDINYRMLEEKSIKNKIPKVQKINTNPLLPEINMNKQTNYSIQQFQLNLYKRKQNIIEAKPIEKKKSFIIGYKCYIMNKLQYLKLDYNDNIILILQKNMITYNIQNNNLFIEYTYINKFHNLILINSNIIYFIDNQLNILTNIIYKKINNAILLNLYNQSYNEKFNIYKWSNFDDTVLKLNKLLTKFNFNINIVLNHAIINHYNH